MNDCKNCRYYDPNHPIQIISTKHPTYYEDMVYCILSGESELTEEDLQNKCPLEVER